MEGCGRLACMRAVFGSVTRTQIRLRMQVNLMGSRYDTLLGVYTGSAIHALTTLATNDDCPSPSSLQSCVNVSAQAGTTLWIQVGHSSYFLGLPVVPMTVRWTVRWCLVRWTATVAVLAASLSLWRS